MKGNGSYQQSVIQKSIDELESDDSSKYKEARNILISMGQTSIDELINALKRNETIRQEAIKIMGQIKSPVAIPALVDAIHDQDFDTRWFATEALIEIGPDSLVPLLEKLIENAESAWFRDGARHVFHGLARQGYYESLRNVLMALDSSQAYLEVPFAAEKAIETLKAG